MINIEWLIPEKLWLTDRAATANKPEVAKDYDSLADTNTGKSQEL